MAKPVFRPGESRYEDDDDDEDDDGDDDDDIFQDFHLLVAIVPCFRDDSTRLNESFTLHEVMMIMKIMILMMTDHTAHREMFRWSWGQIDLGQINFGP